MRSDTFYEGHCMHIMHPEVNKHLWALFNNQVLTVRRLNHQKKLKCLWRAFLFVWLLWMSSWKDLTSFENCQNCPLSWPCWWRWRWWWYYVDLNLDLTERAAEAVVQVAASQTQQERNYHLHHHHHRHLHHLHHLHHHLQLHHLHHLHQLVALAQNSKM